MKIIRETLVYGVTRYLGVFTGIALTPIYTRILTKEEFGVMDIFNVWNGFAMAILPLGLTNAIIRFYGDYDSKDGLRKGIGTVYALVTVTTFVYGLVMLLCADAWMRAFIGGSEYATLYWMSIAIVYLSNVQSVSLQVLRARLEPTKYMVVTIVNFALLTILGFVLVAVVRLGVDGFFIGSLVASIASMTLAIIYIRGQVSLTFSIKESKRLLSYSVHFLSVFLMFQATNILDRYLIQSFCSLSDVGVYSIANRVAGFINILVASFGMAWMPRVFDLHTRKHSSKIFSSMYSVYVYLIFGVAALVILFRENILYILAPGYEEAALASVILVLFQVVMGLAYVATIGIHISKRSGVFTRMAILSILSNVAVSIFLVNVYGLLGIAFGTLVGSVVWIVPQIWISNRRFPLELDYSSTTIMTFILLVSFVVSQVAGLLCAPHWDIILKCLVGCWVTSFSARKAFTHYAVGIRNYL